MKKILLLASLLPTLLYAQIGPIKTKENPLESISSPYLFRTKATDEYTLQLISDNEFEDTAVHISLGHGASEAISSLASLFAVYDNKDQQFTLQHYTFQVGNNKIVALHRGILEFTAGNYTLNKYYLAQVMYNLMTAKNMPAGDIVITYYTPTEVFVNYRTYSFEKIVNLTNVNVPYSRPYAKGDVIVAEDVALLKKIVENPNAYRIDQNRSVYIYDKKELTRACTHILEGDL